MGKIHFLLCGALLFTFGLKVLTLPLEGDYVSEIQVVGGNSSNANFSSDDYGGVEEPPPAYCYLQKNVSGIIITVNKSREEAGNDTYMDYDEICEWLMLANKLSAGTLASLAGK